MSNLLGHSRRDNGKTLLGVYAHVLDGAAEKAVSALSLGKKAPTTVADLQAENARLQAQLEALKQQHTGSQ
jgi:hypothetical protein